MPEPISACVGELKRRKPEEGSCVLSAGRNQPGFSLWLLNLSRLAALTARFRIIQVERRMWSERWTESRKSGFPRWRRLSGAESSSVQTSDVPPSQMTWICSAPGSEPACTPQAVTRWRRLASFASGLTYRRSRQATETSLKPAGLLYSLVFTERNAS